MIKGRPLFGVVPFLYYPLELLPLNLDRMPGQCPGLLCVPSISAAAAATARDACPRKIVSTNGSRSSQITKLVIGPGIQSKLRGKHYSKW